MRGHPQGTVGSVVSQCVYSYGYTDFVWWVLRCEHCMTMAIQCSREG